MTLSRSFFCILFLSTFIFHAQQLSVEEILEQKLNDPSGQAGVKIDGVKLFSQTALPQFYNNRAFELAWNDKKNRRHLMESIESAYDEGLDPDDYHQARIKILLDRTKKEDISNAEKVKLDIFKTDA